MPSVPPALAALDPPNDSDRRQRLIESCQKATGFNGLEDPPVLSPGSTTLHEVKPELVTAPLMATRKRQLSFKAPQLQHNSSSGTSGLLVHCSPLAVPPTNLSGSTQASSSSSSARAIGTIQLPIRTTVQVTGVNSMTQAGTSSSNTPGTPSTSKSHPNCPPTVKNPHARKDYYRGHLWDYSKLSRSPDPTSGAPNSASKSAACTSSFD